MDLKQKFIFIAASISLIFSLIVISDTYAKYQTTAETDTQTSIARWRIKVNDKDVTAGESISNTVTPIFSGNENVKEGVIAPRSTGYFDVVLDTTDVDVSFRYNISTSIASTSAVSDLSITGYSINGGDVVPVTGSISNIGNTIYYGSNVTTTTLRIYIAWEDNETETMDNAADTNATLNNGTADLNVAISFIQVAS